MPYVMRAGGLTYTVKKPIDKPKRLLTGTQVKCRPQLQEALVSNVR